MTKRLRNDRLPVTEHITVTQEVFTLLWKLKISMRVKRLSDVVEHLMRGESKAQKFVAHIENHLKKDIRFSKHAKVIYKICNKTIAEIFEET